MKLIIPEIWFNISFEENYSYEIIIENPNLFSGLFFDIFSQMNGAVDNKRIIFSEDIKEKSLSKCCEFVCNPYDLDFNNKRIQSLIYQELEDVSNNILIEKTCFINGLLVDYIDELINQIPYDLDFTYEMDVFSLLKMYKVIIRDDSESFVERLLNYIKILKRVLDIELVIFVNIKQFFTKEQIEELYYCLLYEKINVLNLAGNETFFCQVGKKGI